MADGRHIETRCRPISISLPRDRQDRLQYTASQLASTKCNKQQSIDSIRMQLTSPLLHCATSSRKMPFVRLCWQLERQAVSVRHGSALVTLLLSIISL